MNRICLRTYSGTLCSQCCVRILIQDDLRFTKLTECRKKLLFLLVTTEEVISDAPGATREGSHCSQHCLLGSARQALDSPFPQSLFIQPLLISGNASCFVSWRRQHLQGHIFERTEAGSGMIAHLVETQETMIKQCKGK
jgi:hypothetical protein